MPVKTLSRSYSLVPRGGSGLACDEWGLALGPVSLAKIVDDAGGSRRCHLRPVEEVAQAIRLAYGPIPEPVIERQCRGLTRVAQLLGSRADALARIYAVLLEFAEIAPEGMAKLDAAASLRKQNPNWKDEPRVPAGGGDGGEWTKDENASGNGIDDTERAGYPRNTGENAARSGVETDGSGGGSDIEGSTDDRLHLPPGNRIDELGDLLEWIANATPEEERAIRNEIKRLYYAIGDIHGGNALNFALSEILDGPGDRKSREEILSAYEGYTRTDPAEMALLTQGVVGGILAFPPIGFEPPPRNPWTLGWAARGRLIEEKLGGNLPSSFPVIDKIDITGVAESIKSIDLNGATYQAPVRLAKRIDTYVKKLAEFNGATWGDRTVSPGDILERRLVIAVPKDSMTAAQQATISAARKRARKLGVYIKIVPF